MNSEERKKYDPRGPYIRALANEMLREVFAQRRSYVEGCSLCESIGKGGFGPAHDARESCESGKHEHCTCDTCF